MFYIKIAHIMDISFAVDLSNLLPFLGLLMINGSFCKLEEISKEINKKLAKKSNGLASVQSNGLQHYN